MRLAGLFAACAVLGWAELAEDPQKVVESLFPKETRMHNLRLRDLAGHLGIATGSSVADVGCGTGEIALILSRAVGPQGRVYAEDINKRSVDAAKKLAKKHRARNITTIHGIATDPRLPTGLDAILLLDVYHELKDYPAMLAKMRASLKPGGRVVIIDPYPRKVGSRDREIQMKNHVLNPDLAESDLRKEKFEIVHRDDRFLDHPDEEGLQWLLVATPAAAK
jgi:tRNA A58 N-methylase Trm61